MACLLQEEGSYRMIAKLLAFLAQIHPLLGNLSGTPLIVFLVVTALTLLFLVGYLTQGVRVGLQLWLAVRRIRSLKRTNTSAKASDIAEILRHKPFKHLWDEYSDTLHEVRKASSGSRGPIGGARHSTG